jgi:nitrate/nitrite-specific signal transduction histidine kinase
LASDQREKRTSDAPADLSRERELVVRQFLRKGVEVTEEVLAENRELRAQLERVGDENTRLRAQIASDDAIRDLFKRIDLLEGERDKLLRRSGELEEKRTEHASRASEVEEELHDLANLYVASSHLHSTLSVRGVVRHVMELLQQLLGARAYALYATSDGRTAHPVAWEQMEPPPAVTVGEGAIGEAMATGLSLVRDDVRRPGTLERPLAVLPLAVKEEVVGAIVILSTLEQKERWAAVDRELFTLLGTHAAISLVASCLFAGQSASTGGAGGARRALMDLQTHLDEQRGARPSAAPPDDRTRSGEREPRG